MKRIFDLSTSALLAMLVVVCAMKCEAKEPAHFVPASLSKAGNIPYPTSSLDAGVVTLSVELDNTGQVTGVGILRDISSVSAQAAAAVRSWMYSPATLDGKPVASMLTINIVYSPGFLGADNIPLPPPAQVQPISRKDPAFLPPQLNTANFAPYPAKAKTQGAVVLDVQLDANGNAANVATLRDVAPLTASAIGALRNWNFSAATYDGKPIPSHMVVAFVFRSPSALLP
ncbi:MAG: energy transducer TonB [Candidatus Acidiferrum sp.]|jgi:TonB family protein